jgi:hypothetical protein
LDKVNNLDQWDLYENGEMGQDLERESACSNRAAVKGNNVIAGRVFHPAKENIGK